ncbi:MAG TPA: hypothetical protein VMT30_02940, partial [Candidatus Saccharimonadia bacterium]|nr:hypothetical protein [Candidatus Saccharimonadia bacterium]
NIYVPMYMCPPYSTPSKKLVSADVCSFEPVQPVQDDVKINGSSRNRVGKFEGLKGRKARYFRDLLHFCRVQNLAQMLDGKDIETSSAALGYVFI